MFSWGLVFYAPMQKLMLLAYLGLLAVNDAQALTVDATVSEDQFVENCESRNEAQRALCFGYVAGVVDSYLALSGANGLKRTKGFCLQGDLNVVPITNAVVSYVKMHRQAGSVAASTSVMTALHNVSPCDSQ